jgi:hypothetical protein
MIAPFEAAKLKIERANKHIQELELSISSYFAENPCALVVEPFPGMNPLRSHAWIARIRKPVPLSLSAIIGDAVHNLRTALDLLACDLVRLNGRSVRDVYFPFCEKANDLSSAIKDRHLHRAGDDIVSAIKHLKPYKGGNVALRSIHDMDIADKHQALLPVIGAVSAPAGTIGYSGGKQFQLPQISTTLPAQDGQIVMGLPASQIPLGTELPARFFLAFGEGEGFGNRPVIECLHDLFKTTKDILLTFTALRPGASFPTTT